MSLPPGGSVSDRRLRSVGSKWTLRGRDTMSSRVLLREGDLSRMWISPVRFPDVEERLLDKGEIILGIRLHVIGTKAVHRNGI